MQLHKFEKLFLKLFLGNGVLCVPLSGSDNGVSPLSTPLLGSNCVLSEPTTGTCGVKFLHTVPSVVGCRKRDI